MGFYYVYTPHSGGHILRPAQAPIWQNYLAQRVPKTT